VLELGPAPDSLQVEIFVFSQKYQKVDPFPGFKYSHLIISRYFRNTLAAATKNLYNKRPILGPRQPIKQLKKIIKKNWKNG
jgi:hypothetical protein